MPRDADVVEHSAPERGRFSDKELAWRDRRALALQQSWPAGVVEACESLDRDFPGWSSGYLPGCAVAGLQRQTVFIAHRLSDNQRLYATSPEVLSILLQETQPPTTEWGSLGGAD